MNRGIAVICVMTPLAILLVSLRIFSRSRSDVGLGADDYVMVASLFAYFGLATTVVSANLFQKLFLYSIQCNE